MTNISKCLNIEIINYEVWQECPLSPSLFNAYIDEAIQNNFTEHFVMNNSAADTFLFADGRDCYWEPWKQFADVCSLSK